jgi:hypothetical protein
VLTPVNRYCWTWTNCLTHPILSTHAYACVRSHAFSVFWVNKPTLLDIDHLCWTQFSHVACTHAHSRTHLHAGNAFRPTLLDIDHLCCAGLLRPYRRHAPYAHIHAWNAFGPTLLDIDPRVHVKITWTQCDVISRSSVNLPFIDYLHCKFKQIHCMREIGDNYK